MNSFKNIFTYIIFISFISILSAQNSINPIQFTSFEKEINLNIEAHFLCELKFPDGDETIDTWNWKLFINNPDSLYTLVYEDSIQEHNQSTFSIILDTIPHPSFSSTWVSEDLYQHYFGIILVYGIDSKGIKHRIARNISIIGEFIENDSNVVKFFTPPNKSEVIITCTISDEKNILDKESISMNVDPPGFVGKFNLWK